MPTGPSPLLKWRTLGRSHSSHFFSRKSERPVFKQVTAFLTCSILFSLPCTPPRWARSSTRTVSHITSMLMIPSYICGLHSLIRISDGLSDIPAWMKAHPPPTKPLQEQNYWSSQPRPTLQHDISIKIDSLPLAPIKAAKKKKTWVSATPVPLKSDH